MIGKTVIIENLNLTPDPDEPFLEGWMSPVSLFDQPERLNPETQDYDKEQDDAMGNYYGSRIVITEMR